MLLGTGSNPLRWRQSRPEQRSPCQQFLSSSLSSSLSLWSNFVIIIVNFIVNLVVFLYSQIWEWPCVHSWEVGLCTSNAERHNSWNFLALITRFWRSGWELCDFNNYCLDVWKCVAGKKIRDNESKLMEILMKMILTAMMMILISS